LIECQVVQQGKGNGRRCSSVHGACSLLQIRGAVFAPAWFMIADS
jgi:hypothetical protein